MQSHIGNLRGFRSRAYNNFSGFLEAFTAGHLIHPNKNKKTWEIIFIFVIFFYVSNFIQLPVAFFFDFIILIQNMRD